MAALLAACLVPAGPWLAVPGPARYVAVAALVATGLAGYALAAWAFRAATPADLRGLAARKA
jgi:hypothetical protein